MTKLTLMSFSRLWLKESFFSLESRFSKPLTEGSCCQIIKWADKLIGEPQPVLLSVYMKELQCLASSVLQYCFHLLALSLWPTHFMVTRFWTNRYKNSFVPAAISLLNKDVSHFRNTSPLSNVLSCFYSIVISFYDTFVALSHVSVSSLGKFLLMITFK